MPNLILMPDPIILEYTMPIQSEAVPPLQQKMEERRDTKLVCFIFYLKCFYCLFCAIIQLISQISLYILVYKTLHVDLQRTLFWLFDKM